MRHVSTTWLRTPVDPVELDDAARVLVEYRVHGGREPAPARTAAWLADQLERQVLQALVARLDGVSVGIATTYLAPATHLLGHVWVLRDLYVVSHARRRGVGGALVKGVRDAAAADGAVRLTLQTETDNAVALRLYRGLGFQPVEGVVALTLPLSDAPRDASPDASVRRGLSGPATA